MNKKFYHQFVVSFIINPLVYNWIVLYIFLIKKEAEGGGFIRTLKTSYYENQGKLNTNYIRTLLRKIGYDPHFVKFVSNKNYISRSARYAMLDRNYALFQWFLDLHIEVCEHIHLFLGAVGSDGSDTRLWMGHRFAYIRTSFLCELEFPSTDTNVIQLFLAIVIDVGNPNAVEKEFVIFMEDIEELVAVNLVTYNLVTRQLTIIDQVYENETEIIPSGWD